MAQYNSGVLYNSGVRYSPAVAIIQPKHMAKVKLELQNKSDSDLSIFGKTHEDAMNGNTDFPTPDPTAAAYSAALAAYDAKLKEIEKNDIKGTQLRAEKAALRTTLEALLTSRGAYVDLTSKGDEAKILSAGFPVQSAPTPTTSMGVPQSVIAQMGPNPGEIIVRCTAVPKAKTYIYECREHSDTAAPGVWQQAKLSAKSSITVSGLISGKKYAFRIKVMGPKDLESPFSDETVCMAP